MKRRLCIASVAQLLLLWQLGDACAAGAFDGEWSGSAAVVSGRCKQAIVTMSVAGKAVTGQARFENGPQNIHGTVSDDGSFGATIGFQHLVGKFIENSFEGTFSGFNCAWKVILRRTP